MEGDADSDGDGKITVDKLYDYAFEQVSKVTPNQTPTKSLSKAEGEIILRQITRIEDIKPVSLPDELIEATQDVRTFVREGAVQQLTKYLNGKNLGLARSAREALEKIAVEDDSLRVRQAATQVLEPIRQSEKKLEEEKRKTQNAIDKAKEQVERKAKEDAERLLAEKKAEEQRVAKAKLETQHYAEEKRIAAEKIEAERKVMEGNYTAREVTQQGK